MKTKLIVPGHEVKAPAEADDQTARVGLTVKTRFAVRVSESGRGADATPPSCEADDDDVVELEFADGTREWTRVALLRARLNVSTRGSATGSTLRIPPVLSGAGSRGAGDWVLKGFKLLGFDPADDVANLGAAAAAAYFEGKLDPAPGLYRLGCDDKPAPVKEKKEKAAEPIRKPLPSSDKPCLVLLHGTFSSTRASFGRLFGTPEWRALCDFYQERIFGLEHRTLSEDPAENALGLVKLLPEGARLHLVSHSRGGLVGEIIARGAMSSEALQPFDTPPRHEQLATLRELSGLLRAKQIAVERFVRVACPARGTVLASDRLDRYFSVLLNLLGAIPGLGDDIFFSFAKATALALIHKKAEPDKLPGLEAMMPGSPFIRLLNLQGATTRADLAVIAGDVEGQGLAGRLGVLATDLFFREDHDLVVNTDSMFRGVERAGTVYYSYERGPDITHFNYFKNDSSRERLLAGLLHKEGFPPQGFRPLEEQPIPELKRATLRTRAGTGPVVFVVPELMATHLRLGDQRIWLELAHLAAGSFTRLALDAKDQAVVDDMFADGYQELLDALASRFEVIPFPYDWRRSLVEEGERLAVEVEAELRKHERPVHLLAHGTGGLVARALIAWHPDSWKKLVQRKGRLVMLGTPNDGTCTAVDLLCGRGRVVDRLALLDPEWDERKDNKHLADRVEGKIARIFRTFPGIFELVPSGTYPGGAQDDWWEKQASLAADELPLFMQRLDDARKVLDQLRGAGTHVEDAEAPICCVAGLPEPAAGTAARTDDTSDRLTLASADKLDEVPTWTMNVATGDMLGEKVTPQVCVDLLERGATELLPVGHVSRGIRPVAAPVPAESALFPTAGDLTDAVLGRRTRRARRRHAEDTTPLRVSVAHGSLEHASYPVAVGHYFGDLIVGAEAFLDKKLDRRFTQRFGMDLYPGSAGTAEVVLVPNCEPPGGIVIGLGEIGAITPDIVSRGIAAAALRYALMVAECAEQDSAQRSWRSAAFSSLLIGTNGGQALSIESAIAAIVQGALQANRTLRERGLWERVRIDQVEFIELYEDIATRAAYVVRDLEGVGSRMLLGSDEKLEPVDHLRTLEGGLPRSPIFEYDTGWWRRVQISQIEKERNEKEAGGLEFVTLTDRARAEKSLQATQRLLIDGFVADAIQVSSPKADVHTALYELLLPNSLKDRSQETANLLLVLDEATANYPWEMMCERGQEPLAIRYGMLRQLKTARFRPDVRSPRGNYALVIGDPVVDDPAYPRLAGAEAEAREMVEHLKRLGYEVVDRIGATALEIVSALFAQEYRIIHIAAHGDFDKDRPERRGVVIGKDRFLTAAEFGQMRVVPELVFLNCCFLAHTAPAPAPAGHAPLRRAVAWNALAATLAQQLIDNGVRAVVAAGWAVNDDAARQFAGEFYRRMLEEDDQFGDAVKHARKSIYDRYKDANNTWGAYQCYGTPAFLLGGRARGTGRETKKPVAKHEIVERLRSIRVNAGATPASKKADVEKVRNLEKLIRTEWRTGQVLYELAETYAELDELEVAIDRGRQALETKEAGNEVPIRAVEQLAFLETRHAEQLRQRARTEVGSGPGRGGDTSIEARQKLLKDACDRHQRLLGLGRTSERLALAGGLCKRIALTEDDSRARRKALRSAAEYYDEAVTSAAPQELDPYPALNWVACRYLSNDAAANETAKPEFLRVIARSELAAQERLKLKPTFWDRVAAPDAALLRALIEEDLEERADEIQKLYAHEFAARSTAGDRASVLWHLDFLAEMLEKNRRKKPAAAVRRLRSALGE